MSAVSIYRHTRMYVICIFTDTTYVYDIVFTYTYYMPVLYQIHSMDA